MRATTRATIKQNPAAAPTPIPALAPVDSSASGVALCVASEASPLPVAEPESEVAVVSPLSPVVDLDEGAV